MTTTALVVIDVQDSFRQRPDWARVSNPDIVEDVAALVDHARAAGDLVVWVLHAGAGPFDPTTGHVRLIDGLTPEPDEPVLTKTSRNAFTTTELGRLLTAAGVRRVLIAGIQTEQCCESTARLAADLGYDVTFVTEATATFPISRPDTGETLDTAAIVARTEAALAGRFATIATLEQALAS